MPAGNEIEHGRYAEPGNQDRQCDSHHVVDARRLRFLRGALCAPNERTRQEMPKECVVEAGEKRNDGQIIQERKIAADNEKDLKRDEQHTRDMARSSRAEREPRHDEFDEMIPCRLEFEQPVRREMEVAADRIRDWLSFVVVVKTSEIAPAWVPAQFDQAGADHDAKPEPAKQPDNQDRRPASWKWPAIQQWAKKDRQEAGFEQLDFPTVTVPDLPNVDDRHVHRPKNRQQDRICVAAENNQRQTETDPGKNRQCVVRDSEPEESRHPQHSSGARTELRLN